MAPSAADALLRAAEADAPDELVALHARHVRPARGGGLPRPPPAHVTAARLPTRAQASRGDAFSFEEAVQTLSKKQRPRLCAALLTQARGRPLRNAPLMGV